MALSEQQIRLVIRAVTEIGGFDAAITKTKEVEAATQSLGRVTREEKALGAAMSREEKAHRDALISDIKQETTEQERLTAAIHRQAGEVLILTRENDALRASIQQRRDMEMRRLNAPLAQPLTSALDIDATQQRRDLEVHRLNAAATAKANAEQMRLQSIQQKRDLEMYRVQNAQPGEGQRGVVGNIGTDIGKVAEWAVATAAIYGTIQMLRSGIETYSEFEMETVKLGWAGKNIAEGFASQHEAAVALTAKILDLKTAYGSAGVEAMQAADVFARLGETQSEVARDTEVAVKLGRIAGMPAQEVARLGEAMRLEFGLSADEFQKVADKLAKIGFMGPATIKGLLEGGTRVGAVWKQAGGDIEEVIALIAAGRMGGRPEPEVANAIRTMMVRLENPTHQRALYELTKKATGTGMDVVKASGESVPPWEIFSELKSIFTKLSETQRGDLAGQLGFTVGSTRGANILQSIMTNFGTAESYKKKMEESSGGELNIKAAQSLDTLKGATDRVGAAWDTLAAKTTTLGSVMTNTMNALAVVLTKNVGADPSKLQELLEQRNRLMGKSGVHLSTPFGGDVELPGLKGIADFIATVVGHGDDAAKALADVNKQIYDLQHPGPAKEKAVEDKARELEEGGGYRGEDPEYKALMDRLKPKPKQAVSTMDASLGGESPSGMSGMSAAMDAAAAETEAGKQAKDSGRLGDEIYRLSKALDDLKHNAKGTNEELERYDALLKEAADIGSAVGDAVKKHGEAEKVTQHVIDEQTTAEEHAYAQQLRGIEMVSKAQSEYEAILEGGMKGPHREELAARKEQQRLQDEMTRLKGVDVDALTQGAFNAQESDELRVQRDLNMSIVNIQVAQIKDKTRMVEEQERENNAVAKKLGMLSDEDMLKARIMAGEMKRGEIKKSMGFGEFSLLGASYRKMYQELGGQVTGDPFGMGGGAGAGAGGAGAATQEAPAAEARKSRSPYQGYWDSHGRFRGAEWKDIPTAGLNSAPLGMSMMHGDTGELGEAGPTGDNRLNRFNAAFEKHGGKRSHLNESAAPQEGVVSRAHPVYDHQGRLIGYTAKPIVQETASEDAGIRQPPRPPAPRYSAGATGGNVSQDPMAVTNAHVFAVAIVNQLKDLLKPPILVQVQGGPTAGTVANKR